LVPGDPRGIALGADGTVYVGLAQPQAVIAIDPRSGAIRKRVVLDSAEIASTKELVTLRTNRDRTRLYIANGSDESASILSLPGLGILREITMEGEPIRDVLPDPNGRYLYLLGRRVHVFDAAGEHEIRTIDSVNDPMAIAATSNGRLLAVIGSETFGSNKATVVSLYDTKNLAEMARDPLQTADLIESALFADRDQALIAASRQHLFEKHLDTKPKPMTSTTGQLRMRIDFGDLVSSDRICLPEGSGPQIAVAGSGNLVLFAERRCNSSGAFTGAERRITPASLYGVNAYALAYDASSNQLFVTDRAGFLTVYRVPRPASAK
jgi:hypothetical protein